MNGVLKLPPAMRILRVAAPDAGASVLLPEKGSFLAAMVAAPNAEDTTKCLRSMGRGSLGGKVRPIVARTRALGKRSSEERLALFGSSFSSSPFWPLTSNQKVA